MQAYTMNHNHNHKHKSRNYCSLCPAGLLCAVVPAPWVCPLNLFLHQCLSEQNVP